MGGWEFKVRQAWQNKKLTFPPGPQTQSLRQRVWKTFSASFVPQPAENNTFCIIFEFLYVVAIVGFTQPLYSFDENDDAVVVIQLQNTLAVSVTVR